MREVYLHEINKQARDLVNRTPNNSVRENANYRCEVYDLHVYIAELVHGRPQEFVEVLPRRQP